MIRAAEPGDEMAVARVHVASWQAAYRHLLPAAYLDGLRAEERAAKYDFTHADPARPRTIVAVRDGRIDGFATTAPAQDEESRGWGELCALYVLPECWGLGIGRALAAAARTHLAESGFKVGVLWILAGNTRADRFYRRDGWAPDGRERDVSVWGITIHELRYVKPVLP